MSQNGPTFAISDLAREFDLTRLKRHAKRSGDLLELGRSCVLPAYRTSHTISLLWRGIAEYLSLHTIGAMFGCASFHGTDPDEHAARVADLDARVRALAELADVEPVVVEQRVRHDDGSVTVHHLVAGPGPARVLVGPADDPDLVLIATEAAAAALRSGTVNAQTCLADGSLRIRGNPDVLVRRLPDLAHVGLG